MEVSRSLSQLLPCSTLPAVEPCSVLCCGTLQCSVLCNPAVFCAVEPCSVLCCGTLQCSVLWNLAVFCAVEPCSVLCCGTLQCSVLWNPAVFCAVEPVSQACVCCACSPGPQLVRRSHRPTFPLRSTRSHNKSACGM